MTCKIRFFLSKMRIFFEEKFKTCKNHCILKMFVQK